MEMTKTAGQGGIEVADSPRSDDAFNVRKSEDSTPWAKYASIMGFISLILMIVLLILIVDHDRQAKNLHDEMTKEDETAPMENDEENGYGYDDLACIFRSQDVPCYRWQGHDLIVEYNLNGLKTYDVDGNDLGYKPLEVFHSTHEIAMSPNGDMVVTHMSTNSFIVVKGVADKLGTTLAVDDVDSFSMERHMLDNDSDGLHAVLFSKTNPDIMFMMLEYADTIGVFDYKEMKMLNKFRIPFEDWDYEAPKDSSHVTMAHTVVEDKYGNLYFTMKKPNYPIDGGETGQGAIGRLKNPLDDSIPDNERWMHWELSKENGGAKTVTFYINIDVKGEWVWFNSITSSEMGRIDARDNDAPTIKMFAITPPHDEKVPSSIPEANWQNPRPGGMIVSAEGNAVMVSYNRYGSIVKIDKDDGALTWKEVPAIHGHSYAYLHISADYEMWADRTQYKGGKTDIVLTASSNGYKGFKVTDDNDQSWSQPDQADSLISLKGFDPETLTWDSMEEYVAPTQHSWFHRSWIVSDTPMGAELLVSTQYWADRLFFVWVNADNQA